MRFHRAGAVGAAMLGMALVASACGSSGGGNKAAKATITVGSANFSESTILADSYHLTKLSDLAPIAGQFTLGAPAECPTRPYCAAGLARVYGIHFKGFKALGFDSPQVKDALANNDVQVAELATTDGTVADRGF